MFRGLLQRSDGVLTSGRLKHADERRKAVLMRLSLGVGWSSGVPYFCSVVLAFP